MVQLKLTEAAKKIIKLAQNGGIDVRVIKVLDDYCAYAYSKKEFEDCLREFDKKILLSTLTMVEYARYCINDLSVLAVEKSQEEACRNALEKFKKQKEEIFRGVLEPYFETGTEGIIWSLEEGDKKGYEGLHPIHTGDYLTIYNEKGEIIFKSKIFPDIKAGWAEYPCNPGYGQPCALGFWIHWTQIGWEPDDWARLFLRGKKPALRAELIQIQKR